MQTRLAAAKDLPDIVKVSNLDLVTILNLGSKGILLDVKELVDEKSNGNIKEFGEKYFPDMWKASTSPDGHAYWLPDHQYMTYKGEPFHSNLTVMIRNDWLEKMNLEKPTTTEELKETLIKFRDGDVNENGKKDEKMLYTPSFNYIAPLFGLPAGLVGIDVDDNTAKSPWLMKDELIEFITYVKSLIEEDLIDVDAWDKSGEVITQKMQSNAVSAVCDWALGTWNDSYVQEFGGQYHPLGLGVNPGEVGATYAEDSYSVLGRTAVTKDCKDTQAVIDLFDMCYTEEYSTLEFYGVEGVSWNENEDGIKVLDPNFKDRTFYKDELKASGSYVWGGLLPSVRLSTQESYMLGTLDERPDHEEYSDKYCVGQKYWYTGEALLGVPSDDEVKRLNKIENDLTTYSSETLIKLCLGQYDLSDIDKYINTMKDLNLEEYVEIYQERHDRYIGK